jgi:sensor domain CHASE-containing protein
MQCVTSDNTLQDVQKRLLDEIEDSQNKVYPVHSTTFNRSIQNRIVLVKQILRLMERYPKMTVKELLYLIECRIEVKICRFPRF